MEITFVPISKKIDRKEFDCGEEELNEYLQKHARQNHELNISRCLVAINPKAPTKPLGYYTISTAQIGVEDIPPDQVKKRLPAYPVPAIIIGRLAVDKSTKGKGLGAKILKTIFSNAVAISKNPTSPAFKFIVVDAKNEKAKAFYEKYGFVSFRNKEYFLLISIETITKCFDVL